MSSFGSSESDSESGAGMMGVESEAENSVGIMLEEGVGTIQDIDQAVYWYTRAASRVSGAHRRTRLSQTPAVAAV